MPSASQVGSTVQPVAGRHQELRDHRLVGGAAGGHQVAVGVAGAGAERLGALDVVAAVDRLVDSGSWDSRAPAPRSLIATAYQAPGRRGGEQPVAGGQRLVRHAERLGQLLGDRAERAGDRGVHVEHQRGRAVAPGQLGGDRRVLGEAGAHAAQRRAGPSARRGRPSRRSAKSSTGNVPSRSCSAARAANRGANRRAASSASTVMSPPPRRPRTPAGRDYPSFGPPGPGRAPRSTGRHDPRRPAGRPPADRPRRRRGQPASHGQSAQLRPDARASAAVRRAGRTRRPAPGRPRTARDRGCRGARVGSRSATRDREDPAQRGVVEGVQHQQAARAQQPARLGHRAPPVRDVLQQLAGGDHVGAAVGAAAPPCASPLTAVTPCAGGLAQRRAGQVDPDVPVALAGQVRREQAGAAAQVDQQRARRGRPAAPARRGPRPASAASRRRRPAATTRRPGRRTGAGSLRRQRTREPGGHRGALVSHGSSVARLAGNDQTSLMSRVVLGLVRASHPEPAVAVTTVAGAARLGGRAPAGRGGRGGAHRAGQPARRRLESTTGWTPTGTPRSGVRTSRSPPGRSSRRTVGLAAAAGRRGHARCWR